MLNTSDTQYVIASTEKASYMWLASPSSSLASHVMSVNSSSSVHCYSYRDSYLGFRPIVCLDSNVTLKLVEGGFEIE